MRLEKVRLLEQKEQREKPEGEVGGSDCDHRHGHLCELRDHGGNRTQYDQVPQHG